MKDLDLAEILEFVDKYVDSFIAWDVLLYYYNNQSACENISSLANRLGRTEKDIKDCIDKMVKKQVLAADGGDYSYSPREELSGKIVSFNKALSDSHYRLTILSHVLSKRRERP